jgi:DNA-binding LacI/PurR family transcriptional regulator
MKGSMDLMERQTNLDYPGNSRKSVRDVARLAGVSTATVSRVVNNTTNVSEHAKRRVLVAIEKLQYRPNLYATELGRANSGVPKRRKI